MKKWLSGLLALCMAIMLLPTSSLALDTSEGGQCGDNLTWKIEWAQNGDYEYIGTLYISGTGEPWEYDGYSSYPWREACQGEVIDTTYYSVKHLVISDGVTRIPGYAFAYLSFEDAVIPDSVTAIDDCAFVGCSNLLTVKVGNSLQELGESAFWDTALYYDEANWEDDCLYVGNMLVDTRYHEGASQTVRDGTTIIADGLFWSNGSLEQITLPNSLRFIGDQAFYACGALDIYFKGTFAELKELQIVKPEQDPETLKYVHGTFLFTYPTFHTTDSENAGIGYCGENLKWMYGNGELVIEGTGEMYFGFGNPWDALGKEVKTVSLPNGLTKICYDAFEGFSNLQSIQIPSSVTEIGMSAFSYCTSLKEVILPEGLTEVSLWLFSGCTALEHVYIPASVTEIHAPFSNCTSLYDIEVAEDNAVYNSKDGVLYSKDGTSLLICPAGKNGKFVVPEQVETIQSEAFWHCNKITDIKLPSGITEINNGVFAGCTALETITIPASVSEIGGWAFDKCTSLSDVYFEGTEAQWNQINIESDGKSEGGNDCLLNAVIHFNSHDHIYTSVTTAPTCDAQGYTTHICSICGDSYVDSYVAATGHKWDSGKVTKAATESVEGLKTYTCTVCGETKTETIPKLTPKPADPTPAPTVNFVDVQSGAYYADAVAWAVAKGVTNGTSDTTFSPSDTCTRAQVVTFLWRAAGSPEPKSTANPFTDVDVNSYYGKAVLWAVEQNITKGTSDTTFSPAAGCTRGQVVTFLHRAAGTPAAKNSANPFTDVAAGTYYYNAVLWAVEQGITNGTSDTTFSPNDTCTRGQIVTFLYRDMK